MKEDESHQSQGRREEEIELALERLVREKLGLSEGAALLGNKLYKKPTSEEAELHLRDRVIPHVNVRLTLERSDLELGESFPYEIELQNIGKAPVFLSRIEEVAPGGFEVASHSDTCTFGNNLLNLHGMRLDPHSTEEFGVTLRVIRKGAFILAPKVWFMAETGRETSCKPEPASINVSQTILPGRVTTGFQDLDNLLLGGIPQGFDVVLTSASCDERDLLIRRFLEAGSRNNEVTFYVTMSAAGILKLAEEFQENFTIFVCSQKLDETLKTLPNVFKMGGVENLTELNISLESAFRRLPKPNGRSRRVCVDILSDVLLQHHAVQTRKWLAGLVSEFRSRGFTSLAVMNPHMHPSEENHAVRSLFQGEISIYEKETKGDQTKYLRIMRMYNQRYLENEMPLRKARLMTASGKLPCCTRMPNL